MATTSQTTHEGRFLGAGQPKSSRKVSVAFSDKVLKKMADIPQVYRQTYRRAMLGKSLRAAVNSFCLECVGYQREEVKNCTAVDCPLFPYRPYQKSDVSSRSK